MTRPHSPTEPAPHDPLAALRIPDYRKFAAGFACGSTGLQVMNTAVQWEVWQRTHDPMALAWMGLCRALPVVALGIGIWWHQAITQWAPALLRRKVKGAEGDA